jgi:hypothetical protein
VRPRRDRRSDLGIPAWPADQISLRDKLLECLHHNAAREAEISGKGTGRRHPGAVSKPAISDTAPDLALDLPMERNRKIAT